MDQETLFSSEMDLDPPEMSSLRPHHDLRTITSLPLPSPPPPSEDPVMLFEQTMAMFYQGNRDFQKGNISPLPVVDNLGDSSSRNRTGLEDDREHLANLMRDENEDHAWMDEEPEEDDELSHWNEIYTTLKKRKETKGVLNREDDMKFMRAHKQLLVLNRLRNNGRHGPVPPAPVVENDEDENEMFIPESNYVPRNLVIDRHRNGKPNTRYVSGDDEDGADDDSIAEDFMAEPSRPRADEAGHDPNLEHMLAQALGGKKLDGVGEPADVTDLGLKKNGEPRKRRAPLAKDARTFHQQKIEKEREKERKKAEKKKAKDSPKEKKCKGKGKKDTGKKGKGKIIKNGESLLKSAGSWNTGEDALGERFLRDLVQHDPIAERLCNPIFNVEAEPVMDGRHTKATQFQKLYANIPEGSNKAAAKSDRAKLKQAAKSFGYGKVKAQDGKWLVSGMSSTIYHHQLLGAQWMVERELSDQAPHGGLLADSMGLGKTIQTLALMVANPPMAVDIERGVRATLIVCPATLVHQWITEIEHHVEKGTFPKVLHYKTTSKIPKEILQDLDIVVTSYHEVMSQFPFPSKEGREEISIEGYQAWWERAVKNLGNLHKVNWYRVVLDEAHQIKNNSARTSLACQNLHSIYRWCLTGTPLMNRLEELFPYLRFLKADYTMDWKTFQRYFCDPHVPDCHLRINTLLSYTMIRRTMTHTILGRPIITLPKPHPLVRLVHFSPAEKIIYRLTENRFRANLNKFFEKGDATRNYSVFMVQLLRLRQLTSHPWMIERTMRECWTLEDIQELKKRLSDISYINNPFYRQVAAWIGDTEAERQRDRDNGKEHEVTLPFGKGDFGHAFEMGRAFETLDEKEMMTRITCGKCYDFPHPAMQTDCGHIFCGDCIETEMHKQYASEGSDLNHHLVCPTCERIFTKISPVRVKGHSPGFNDDMDIVSEASGSRRSKRTYIDPLSKGIDIMGHEPHTDSTWVSLSDTKEGFALAPSAKTATLKAILLQGFHEAPLDKVVIYVQFRTLARIVARICNSEGWKFLYLTGDTSQEHRHKAIARFRNDPDAKILIAGLKCGGLGLNFPWANRCISLDLWWNHAIEQQAFGRIFRIGQEKETYMTRIVIHDSVDQRLLTMQLHKLATCEKAIRDGAAGEKPSLSLKQLTNLFGFLKTDEDDNIVSVEADYEDMEEWTNGGAGRIDGEDICSQYSVIA